MSDPTHTEILALLRTSAYDPAIIPTLQSYVRAQLVAAASSLHRGDVRYSFEANRMLIKLYRFFPGRTADGGEEEERAAISACVAFLALLEWPETEFGSLGCLIPERVMGGEVCATLVRCSDHLESCRFASFWPEFRKLGIPEYGPSSSPCRRLLADAVNGSRASGRIREKMVGMLQKTYRTAPLEFVLKSLDLKDEGSLISFADKVMLSEGGKENEVKIVERVEDGFVVFAQSAENGKRVGSAYKEGVSYEAVAGMMARSKIRGQ